MRVKTIPNKAIKMLVISPIGIQLNDKFVTST